MSKLKRYFSKGSAYFVTMVFHGRKRIPESLFSPLYSAITNMAAKHNSKIIAWVLLPDHIHFLVTPQENILDRFVHDLKLSFGVTYRKALGIRSGRLWQRRYWDHVIRDQEDMNRHIDYIHYNPVKHEYVDNPGKWRFSSFDYYRKAGYYQDDWGAKDPPLFVGDFGE